MLDIKFIAVLITLTFSGYWQTYGQVLPVEDLFEYDSIFKQKNIRVSERIKEEWDLPEYYVQQTYYNANKDSNIDSLKSITQVLSIHYLLNNTKKILKLFDDGCHFDNKAGDGIYGNFLVDDSSILRTDEIIIDIQLDTLGINYVAVHPPVNYHPENPRIIIPQHKSIISCETPEISWAIDPKSDGCGAILLGSPPILGKELEDIVWQKEFKGNTNKIFTARLPLSLLNNKEYTLIIWSYTNTKIINNNWNGGAYSIEWCKFFVDTLHKSENLILSQNFPNPFNSRTVIKYDLPDAGNISIKIFDNIGQKITTLINQEQSAGEHVVLWNGKNDSGNNVASGVYFYNLKFNRWSTSHKMLLTR